MQPTYALVDSGSEHTLVGRWLSKATGALPGEDDPEIEIGIGGKSRPIRFTHCQVRLPPPPGSSDLPYEWDTEIGVFLEEWEPPWPVLLGQIGFFDQFTVSMNRVARGLAVESLDVWDGRYPFVPEEAEERWTFPY